MPCDTVPSSMASLGTASHTARYPWRHGTTRHGIPSRRGVYHGDTASRGMVSHPARLVAQACPFSVSATYNTQRTAHSVRRTAYNKQRPTRSAQRTTYTAQRSTHSAQRRAYDNGRASARLAPRRSWRRAGSTHGSGGRGLSAARADAGSPNLHGARHATCNSLTAGVCCHAVCPHLRRDWARPCHICTGTGASDATYSTTGGAVAVRPTHIRCDRRPRPSLRSRPSTGHFQPWTDAGMVRPMAP